MNWRKNSFQIQKWHKRYPASVLKNDPSNTDHCCGGQWQDSRRSVEDDDNPVPTHGLGSLEVTYKFIGIVTNPSLIICRKGRNQLVENKKEKETIQRNNHQKKLSRKGSLDERIKRKGNVYTNLSSYPSNNNLNKSLSNSLTGEVISTF